MVNTLIDSFNTDDLGRTMPQSATVAITAGQHYFLFYFLSCTDIWTEDGWLVTAVQDDQITHHVRKGTTAGRMAIEPETLLYHSPLSIAKQKELAYYRT